MRIENSPCMRIWRLVFFPGSNCDHDAYWTNPNRIQTPARSSGMTRNDLETATLIIVPGVFRLWRLSATVTIANFSPPGWNFRQSLLLLACWYWASAMASRFWRVMLASWRADANAGLKYWRTGLPKCRCADITDRHPFHERPARRAKF